MIVITPLIYRSKERFTWVWRRYFTSSHATLPDPHTCTRAREQTRDCWRREFFFLIWALIIFSYVWKKPLKHFQPTFSVHGRHKISIVINVFAKAHIVFFLPSNRVPSPTPQHRSQSQGKTRGRGGRDRSLTRCTTYKIKPLHNSRKNVWQVEKRLSRSLGSARVCYFLLA